jgi:hypothetical protein
MSIEIKNAIIESARIDNERGLSAWLSLDYGGSGQGFGGFVLYIPSDWQKDSKDTRHKAQWNYAGHFIYRVMQIAGVDEWSKLKGKTVRAKCEHTAVHAIGHIVKDDWFDPSADFAAMKPTGAP